MRKFLTLMLSLMLTVTVLAQETVITKPAALDNNYVQLNVGIQSQTSDLVKNLYPTLNIYAGHQFTPVWGLELNGEMLLHNGFKNAPTFVDATYVGVAGTVNMNNLISGYAGYTRKFEVVPFVGLGWLHNYGTVSNHLATKMGVDMRLKLVEDAAWSLNIRPNICYALTGDHKTQYNVNRSRLGLEVGVTYKFKDKDGKHNFNQKEMIDYDKYTALNDEVNALRARKPEVVEKVVEKVIEKEAAPVVTYAPTNVGFEINSAELPYTQRANIESIARFLKENESVTVEVKGYADAATGTPDYNLKLSLKRAAAVRDALVAAGVDESRISTMGMGSETQYYESNELNRAVIMILK